MSGKNLFRILVAVILTLFLASCGGGSSDGSSSGGGGSTGLLTPLLHSKVSSGGNSPSVILTSPDGRYFYALNRNSGGVVTIGMFSIASDGELDPLSPAIYFLGCFLLTVEWGIGLKFF